MAITIKRQKDGKMKTTKRTGFDKLSFKFGSKLEEIKSGARKVGRAVKRVAKAPARAQKRFDTEQARKEIRDIERAFGTVDKYLEFNPDFRGRASSLLKRAK